MICNMCDSKSGNVIHIRLRDIDHQDQTFFSLLNQMRDIK